MSAALAPQLTARSGSDAGMSVAGTISRSIVLIASTSPRWSQVRSFHSVMLGGAPCGTTSSPKRGSPGRSCSTKNHPRIVNLPGLVALRHGSGEIESEEVDIRFDLRLEQRCQHRAVRAAVVKQPNLAIRGDGRLGIRIDTPLGLLCEHDHGRVLFQKLAAYRQHEPRLAQFRPPGGNFPILMTAQIRTSAPGVQGRDVPERFLDGGRVRRGIAWKRVTNVPELPEIAASLVRGVLAP